MSTFQVKPRKAARRIKKRKRASRSQFEWVNRWFKDIDDGVYSRQDLREMIDMAERPISPRPGVPHSVIASGAIKPTVR